MTIPLQIIFSNMTPSDAARARTEELAARRDVSRGDVKTRTVQPSASVVRLFHDENYGFLEDPEAGEVHFHADSVPSNGFRGLRAGGKVHYQAELGDNGLQASIVKPTGGSRTTGTEQEDLKHAVA